MKREEAIKTLTSLKEQYEIAVRATEHVGIKAGFKDAYDAINTAIAALRGPTREQVEALRGEWIKRDGYTECSKCEYWYPSGEVEEEDDRTPFCPRCGAPMTDEAVEITLRRLEALKDGTTD